MQRCELKTNTGLANTQSLSDNCGLGRVFHQKRPGPFPQYFSRPCHSLDKIQECILLSTNVPKR